MILRYFNAIIGIFVSLSLSAMHVGYSNSNPICTGVILRNQDNSKRFYVGAQTVLHFDNLVQTIKENALHKQDRLFLPEYSIDCPYLNYKTLHSLCAYIHKQYESMVIDTLHDVSVHDIRALAQNLGLPNASDILKDTAYLVHPEAEKLIKIPDILARAYQQNLGFYIYKEKFPQPTYALASYQTIFDCYTNKPLSIKNTLTMEDIDSLCNLHDILLPQENIPATLAECILPSLSTIIKSNQDMSIRIRAIQNYTAAFNCLDEETKRIYANQAEDANEKGYNMADHLYMLMYDPAISKPFNALLKVSEPYIDEKNVNTEHQAASQKKVKENRTAIITQLKSSYIAWLKQDPAAILFWHIKRYSKQQECTNVQFDEAFYDYDSDYKKWQVDDATLSSTSIITYLNDKLQNGSDYLFGFYMQNTYRTHIPLIEAIVRCFTGNGVSRKYNYYHRMSHLSKLICLRMLPEVDLKALNNFYIDSEINLNFGHYTRVAPLTLCNRSLYIYGTHLPESIKSYVYDNPKYTGQYTSQYCILPPDWRTKTLKQWALVFRSLFLIYTYIIKPLNICNLVHSYVEAIGVERRKNIEQQITAQVLPELPEPDVAALFFQQAHKTKPFLNDTQQMLHDILHKPLNQDTVFSYKTMDQVKHLIDTTREIEKNSLDGLFQSKRPFLQFMEGGLISSFLTVIFKVSYPIVKNFIRRSIGIVAELFGGNPARWVEPLHTIRI
ncbi:MAG TPA: hypothetical protein VGW78_06530 [Candidatus Babeliales bacterium]|jgi:hypothetical protein|nr:hypothetical protein [Candidatus Babeliales bacterium]